jgi:hypothetical protein
VRELNDTELLDLVQRQTLRYFWDHAHPKCGLVRDRSIPYPNYGSDAVTSGGSGFAVQAIIVGVERGFISREEAVERLLKIVKFLWSADSYHGIFPHFLNGETGRTIAFTRKDDGADLVETSYLFVGLLSARQYFDRDDVPEIELRNFINWLWNDAEWNWHTRGGRNALYWHWSPNNGWSMNFEIRGWNECLITYVLAASSARYAIEPNLYHLGWAQGLNFKNGREYYGTKLPLGPDYGGPLYFAHYSFLGLDPRNLVDKYANYWEQNVSHARINREYCVRNPKQFKGFGANSWGLTSSEGPRGYADHEPLFDVGVISPTAALSSLPYTPADSMLALRHFYEHLGDRLFADCGFLDAFSETENWVADTYLAIDQGPIIVMIENYRSGLLWNLFMSCPEVRLGLQRLEFGPPPLLS